MHSSKNVASCSPSRHPNRYSVPDESSALSPAVSPIDDSQTEPESDFIDDNKTEPETQYSERILPPSASKGSPKVNELLLHALRSLSDEHSSCSVHGVFGGNCIAELRQVLDTWKTALQGPSSAPPRIAYRLDRRDPKEQKSFPYTPEELLTQKLDNEHVTVLRHLQIAATQLGFELYLANATLEIVGSGNAYDPHIPLDDIEMLSWPKPKMALNFSHWVKVERGPVEAPPFEFEDDQWIPNPPPDHDSFCKKEYDWALRPAPGELRELHIVTVIVIQSRQVGDDFHMSEISPAQASIALRESSTSVPTSEEKVLFDRLEKWCGKHLQDLEAIGEALHALSVSSIRWKDFKRWDNSMRVCNVQKNTRLLPFRIFVKACEEFGFPLMKPFLQDTMIHGGGNKARYGLLRCLAPAIPGEEFEFFCRESKTTILHHLSPPSEEDADFFAELALEYGTESFEREVIPRLETFQPGLKFWSTLASKLRRLAVSSDQMAGPIESITHKVFKCFEPFPATWSSNPDIEPWIDAIRVCIELEDRQRIGAIIRQIVEETNLEPDKAYVANYYLVPSVGEMARMLEPTGLHPRDQIFAPYWAMVTQVITYELLFGDQFTDPDNGVRALTKAIQFSQDPGPLNYLRSSHETKHFDPEEEVKKLSKKQPQILESLARGLSELPMSDFSEQEAQNLDRLVLRLVRLYVQNCDLPHLVSIANVPTYRADLDSNFANEAPALHLIKLCHEVAGGDLRAIRTVLNRALEIPTKIDANYLFSQLSPFIRSLRSYLEKQTPSHDLSVHPYLGFINQVVQALEDFLKGKPAHYEEIQALIGSCSSSTLCEFVNDPEKEVLLSRRADKHRIQQELQCLFSRRWLRWIKDDIVKKDKLLLQANRWDKSMAKAKTLWRGIGQKDVLRRIMGDKLSEMEALLPEKMPIVSGPPSDSSELRTHPNSPFRPTSAIMRGGTEASTPAPSSSSSRPMKRTLSGDSAQTPHKKQKSEEKVVETIDRLASPRFS